MATLAFALVRPVAVLTHDTYAPKNVWTDSATRDLMTIGFAAFAAIDGIGSQLSSPMDSLQPNA
jgi:hypothetical protein